MIISEESKAQQNPNLNIFDVDVPADADTLWLLKNAERFTHVNGDRDILLYELNKSLSISKADLGIFFERLDKITPAKPPAKKQDASRGEIDQFLLDTEPTDYGNALCVAKIYPGQFATNKAMGLLYYDGRRWLADNADAMLSAAIVATLKRRAKLAIDEDKPALLKRSVANAGTVSACKTMFLNLPDLYVPVDKFDQQHHLLNVWNGTINLKTGKLQAHRPADYITHLIGIDYKPDATCPTWLSFLAQIIDGYNDENSSIADYIQMSIGYSATGETREHTVFYMWGKKGRNGKGTLADTLQAVLGSYAAGCSFNTLTRRRDQGDQGFDIAVLRGARMVFTSESGKETKMNEDAVKAFSGQDTLQAAQKGKDAFSFKPSFKIWAMSNHPPKGDTNDDSFWGRLKMINFPHSFVGKEDKTLRDRLMSQESQEGILTWIVEGAVKWYALGSKGLQAPSNVVNLVQNTRDAQDSVRAWVKADCVFIGNSLFDVDAEIKTDNNTLFTAYERWCKEEERDDIKTRDALGKRLADMGYERYREHQGRGFKGIRPLTDDERGTKRVELNTETDPYP